MLSPRMGIKSPIASCMELLEPSMETLSVKTKKGQERGVCVLPDA